MSINHIGDVSGGALLNQGSINAGAYSHIGEYFCMIFPVMIRSLMRYTSVGNVNNHHYANMEDPDAIYRRCRSQLLQAVQEDPNDYRDSLITRKGKWLKGTCQWILSSPMYTNWLQAEPGTPARLLWITGDPGKGKTMISLFLLNHGERINNEQSDRRPDRRKIIHFFAESTRGEIQVYRYFEL